MGNPGKRSRQSGRYRPGARSRRKSVPARLAKSAQEVGGVEAAVSGSGAAKSISPSGVGGVGRKHGWR